MQVKTIILALAGLMAVTSAQAELKAFKVNGETVSVAQQKEVYDAAIAQGQPAGPELERWVKQHFVEQVALLQEAKKAKVSDDPLFKKSVDKLMIDVWVQKYARTVKVKDEDVKKLYDDEKARYGDTEYQLRRILVKTEDQAKNLIKRINNGSDFGKLATEFSEDNATKAAGGLMGWVVPRNFPTSFSSVFTALKPGDVAQTPIRAAEGWLIVKLENKRVAKDFPTFEQLKPRLTNAMLQIEVQKKAQEVVKAAKVQ